MAVRLQMKLGVIAEPDRVIDSPDTVVVVEPSVGSVARSKGNLYLIVTSTVASQRAQEATQLAAETIRSEYYYDESAGIRVCIQKAIASANKRLNHQRDRLGLHGDGENGPIGIGVAVVRGNELYVATIGPAEAYLIRQARLSTLPDPHRERGLPTGDLEPDVWRGEISVGDSLVLVSPNVMTRLGPDELKDAMVTLHPQPAMEHLHHRFVAADGAASDAMIAIEATEVASTQKSRTLVPVRPGRAAGRRPGPRRRSRSPTTSPTASRPSRPRRSGPGPRRAARSTGLVLRLQDLLPRRRTAYRRVTPAAAEARDPAPGGDRGPRPRRRRRRPVRRRLGGRRPEPGPRPRVADRRRRRRCGPSQDNLAAGLRPGHRPVRGRPAQGARPPDRGPRGARRPRRATASRRRRSSRCARRSRPASTGSTASCRSPQRDPVRSGRPSARPTSAADDPRPGRRAVRPRPGDEVGLPDRLRHEERRPASSPRARTRPARPRRAPKLIALGAARDLLIVDENNVLWRWRPADDKGAGTTTRIRGLRQRRLGRRHRGRSGRSCATPSAGLYNLYVVDPSEQNSPRLLPRPATAAASRPTPIDRLAVARDVSKVDALVHRQRHLRHRRRPHRPVRRRPSRGLGDQTPAARTALAPRAARTTR